MKFLDVFHKIQKGNYALTDEAIYSSLRNNDELIPLYGGNKEHSIKERKISVSAKTKKGIPITIFSGEGIIISLDGSAGSMTYKYNEKFALNHHAGFITPINGAMKRVNLKYFALFFQGFYKNLSVSDGSKTLSLDQIYSKEFDLPPVEIQNKIVEKILRTQMNIKNLSLLKEKYVKLLSKSIEIETDEGEIPLKDVLNYCSRNDSLSEAGVYNHTTMNNNVEVLSGSDVLHYGRINSKIIKVHFVENKQCLHVISRGNAGKLKYLPKGTYATNTNAFLLFLTEDYKKRNEIDTDLKEQYILKFLLYYLQPIFYKLSSSSDLGVFPLTDIFKSLTIPDILYSKRIEYVVDLYETVNKRIDSIRLIECRYNELLDKEVLLQ